MTERDMILALLDVTNTLAVLPVTAALDNLASVAPAASLQQLPGERWIERYVDGSGIRELPFAILYRTSGADTSGRADAAAALRDLADAYEALAADDLTNGMKSIRALDTPVLSERSSDTTAGSSEVWRATFVLESE
jgi:hypothetical protein